MAAIGDARWVLESAFPSDYAKRRCLCLPCLWLCMRSSSHKRTTQNIPSIHPSSSSHHSARPLAHVLIVVVIVGLLLSSSPSSPCCAQLPVSGYCSHPTRSFPPRRHSPTTTPALLSAALRHLCTSSLGRQTNRQTDGRTHSQTDRQTPSRQLRKPGNTKSPSLLNCVTRPLASCNILCNTIPQSAHASYALQYLQLASSAIPVPRLPPRLALAHRAAAAS